MHAWQVGLGTLLLAASGLVLAATGQPGAGVPFGVAGVAAAAAVGLGAAALTGRGDERTAR